MRTVEERLDELELEVAKLRGLIENPPTTCGRVWVEVFDGFTGTVRCVLARGHAGPCDAREGT